MKTIFITSFHQFVSRNILHTPILKGLAGMPGVRLVIFAPEDKQEYFKKEFMHDNVHIECVGTSREANGFWSLFFKRAAQAMVGPRYKEISRRFSKNDYRDVLINIFFRHPLRILSKFHGMHSAMRFLNFYLVRRRDFENLFKKYSPDLVFATDAQNENDAALMNEARRRGVKVISMIRSWDNMEMYGILRVIPDKLLVWGEFIKQEILRLNTIDPRIITLVGVPHYDRYLKPTMPREAFFHSLGVDPEKKLIFFTPVGDMYVKDNDVDAFILEELSKLDANVLVRMPPADTVSLGAFIPPKNIFFYRPGIASKHTGRREISREDDDHLINSLHFSDAVVSGPSTIMLDAIVVHKPVLLFGFERTNKSYKESVASLYDSRHIKAVIDNGGARFAKNIEEFRSGMAEYLSNPERDAEGRKRAVDFVCFKTDGKSCERVLEVLKSSL